MGKSKSIPAIALNSGTFRVELDGTEYDLDLLLLKLATESTESSHGLMPDPQTQEIRPTPAFLKDLAAAIRDLGLPGCTPTTAYQLWHLTHRKMAELKKSTGTTPASPSGSGSTPVGSRRKRKPAT